MAVSALHPQLIVDGRGVAEVCRGAALAGAVALDTEADSLHSYYHKLCLVQISFAGRHFVMDPLAAGREALAPLAELCARRDVAKIMHGADYDLRVLDRDLGARIVGLRDTQVAAQLLGEPQIGLGALVEKELAVKLDKEHQRADWGARPLRPELLDYAVADTAHLQALAAALAQRLAALGRHGWWEEECVALEEVHWEAPPHDELAFERIKGARRLRGAQRDRLAALWAWREGLAAGADLPPFRIMRGETLLRLAQEKPAGLAALAAIPGIGNVTVRRHGEELLRLLAAPPPAPGRPGGTAGKLDRAREARLRLARDARDEVALALGVAPGVLAPRVALELVVDRRPRDEGTLATCLGRRWRAEVLGARLLSLVEQWLAAGSADGAAQ